MLHSSPKPSKESRFTKRLVIVAFMCASCVLVAIYLRDRYKENRLSANPVLISFEAAKASDPLDVSALVTAKNLDSVDIARINLLCAQGLPGTESLDINQFLATLDRMARRLRAETERHWYRFQRNPSEFENSVGLFRMLMLTVVLAEDFGIHYDEARKSEPATTSPTAAFFAHPDDVFLHGLLGPNRQGTCSSMPVLYVAVGRRLGYPLKLVTTKTHLFVRWEDNTERFNIEATSHGLSRFPDDYYRHWPFEVTRAEEAAQGYLKSLTPAEELAVFLSIRAMCLRDTGRLVEARQAFAVASRLAPDCQSYRDMQATLEPKLGHSRQKSPTQPPVL
jgi:hypothetical protein